MKLYPYNQGAQTLVMKLYPYNQGAQTLVMSVIPLQPRRSNAKFPPASLVIISVSRSLMFVREMFCIVVVDFMSTITGQRFIFKK
jgi:hypothetical protein